jgi:deazaflavin-dependent oxidoreductase (nitroreductase family)
MSDLTPQQVQELNRHVVDELRSNGGRVGGPFEGAPLLVLTTQGRRSGRPRTNPVVYLRDGDRYLVFASNAGGPTDPAWYRNLQAHPQATVELGTGDGTVRPHAATAVALDGAERDDAWERQCTVDPAFRDYERRTARTIPVVALHLLDLDATPELLPALGQTLVQAHGLLRAQLADVRSQLDQLAREASDPLPRDATTKLHETALSYCYGLQLHHIREEGAFSALEDHLPDLAPAIAALRADHHDLEPALAALEATLAAGPPRTSADLDALAHSLTTATTHLEAHFTAEETHLLPTLT